MYTKLYPWDNPSWANTPPYRPSIKYGKVIKVYDGDTFTIVFRLSTFGKLQRHSIRIADIDAPEVTGASKEKGIISRDKLRTLILNKLVKVDIVKLDKYGRFLAHVYREDIYINEYMVKNKLATPYKRTTN